MPTDLTEARFCRVDRDGPAGVSAVRGDGADLIVDCACYTATHAEQLLPLARQAVSTVMLSGKAVYVDESGNHVNSDMPPRLTGPVSEQQPTVEPGSMPYDSREGYGPNKVAVENVLLDSGLPVTVLRASKVHGESAAVNIAALVDLVAERPGHRILNAADPDPPDGLTISRIIAGLVGHDRREILLDDDAPAGLGAHPWHRIPPITLDAGAASALGHQPMGTHETTAADTRQWLVSAGGRFPGSFDYAAEDAHIARRGATGPRSSRCT